MKVAMGPVQHKARPHLTQHPVPAQSPDIVDIRSAAPSSPVRPQGMDAKTPALSLTHPAVGAALAAAQDGGMAARTGDAPLTLHPRPQFNVFSLVHDFYLGEMLQCCGPAKSEDWYLPSVERFRNDLDSTREAFVQKTVPQVYDYLFDVVVHELWSGSRFDGTWQNQAPTWCRGILQKHHDTQRSYSELRHAIARKNFTNAEFARQARAMFLLPGWRKDYGGQAWAHIADLLGTLDAKRPTVWLDTVFDTEHNTNSVFNKGGTGIAEGDARDDALKALLDYKRHHSDPRVFSEMAASRIEPDPIRYNLLPFPRLVQRAQTLHLAR